MLWVLMLRCSSCSVVVVRLRGAARQGQEGPLQRGGLGAQLRRAGRRGSRPTRAARPGSPAGRASRRSRCRGARPRALAEVGQRRCAAQRGGGEADRARQVGHDVGRRAAAHDPAGVHQLDPVGQPLRLVEVVRGQQDGRPPVAQRATMSQTRRRLSTSRPLDGSSRNSTSGSPSSAQAMSRRRCSRRRAGRPGWCACRGGPARRAPRRPGGRADVRPACSSWSR